MQHLIFKVYRKVWKYVNLNLIFGDNKIFKTWNGNRFTDEIFDYRLLSHVFAAVISHVFVYLPDCTVQYKAIRHTMSWLAINLNIQHKVKLNSAHYVMNGPINKYLTVGNTCTIHHTMSWLGPLTGLLQFSGRIFIRKLTCALLWSW
jgi:hypothetical protein